ncbi:MAG TPA: succino-amino-deoxyadenylate synthase PurZ [Trebonia sp.]|nr:succino-amino-deoxyadenylate synthase PurZ [Trebonia sp.]
MSQLQVVVGGQAGSEGKGAIAAFLAREHRRGLSIRVAGPNAGHTVIGRCPPDCEDSAANLGDAALMAFHAGSPLSPGHHASDAHPWRLQQVPVAAVSNQTETLAIAAGSEVDLAILSRELRLLDAAGYHVSQRLIVDHQATVLEPHHAQAEAAEQLVGRIGSTGKGVGAARADRAMRGARIIGQLSSGYSLDIGAENYVHVTHSVADIAAQWTRDGGDVLIEGTQGHLLGTHAGHYPKCTTSDCTAIDFLSMAGLSPWVVEPEQLEVWVVFRTYPIRVAGDSGPLTNEVTWEELGLEPELTTVTRKIRRVGLWNGPQARAAMVANGMHPNGGPGPVRAALTMADHVIPALRGMTDIGNLTEDADAARYYSLITKISRDIGALVELVGTGPDSVIDLRKGM